LRAFREGLPDFQFLGKEIADTGTGRPITQNYCVEYEYIDGVYPIKIYL